MSSSAKSLSNQLKTEIESQASVFEGITREDWNLKSSPEKWSKKEILGHLIDSALNNIHRFVRIQYDDKTNIYYDQDFWVKANNYQNQEVNSIVQLWKLINFQIANTWANIPEDQLQKTIPVKNENPTLGFLMEDYITHLQHHLKQIMK